MTSSKEKRVNAWQENRRREEKEYKMFQVMININSEKLLRNSYEGK